MGVFGKKGIYMKVDRRNVSIDETGPDLVAQLAVPVLRTGQNRQSKDLLQEFSRRDVLEVWYL
jgi:hypothetical protein